MLTTTVREGVCLDYANTRSWRGSAVPTERLHDVADLLNWLKRSADMSLRGLRQLSAWASEHPAEAGAVFDEAIAIRETIYRVFSALAEGESVREKDFTALKNAIAASPVRSNLVWANGHYAWRIDELEPRTPHLLAAVLWSAGDLMLNVERRRIRRCANEACLWLFLDESKSGTRRWCDMSSCGNRAKARRHYSKIKSE
jgi:predicted RNA-binding Zn ribbon-like protein